MYLEGQDFRAESSSKCLFSRKRISVKIQITGRANAGSAAGRIQVSRRRGPPTGFRAELARSHMITVLTSGKPRPAMHGKGRSPYSASLRQNFELTRCGCVRGGPASCMRSGGLVLYGLWGRYVGSLCYRWTLWSSMSLVRVAGGSSRRRQEQERQERGKGSTSQGLWTQLAEYGQLGIDITLALGNGTDEGGHRC